MFAGLGDTAVVNANITSGFDAVTGNNYTYHKDTNDFTFNATIAAGDGTTPSNSAKLQSILTPKAGDTANLNVKIGATSVDVVLSSDGKITAKDGSKLSLVLMATWLRTVLVLVLSLQLLDALTQNTTSPAAAVPVTITTEDKTEIKLAGATVAGQVVQL